MNRSPWVVALAAVLFASRASAGVPDAAQLDAEIARAMAATQAKGLALAVIDDGRVVYARSAGVRNQAGDPLENDTVMYGASLTKATFAWFVMQLVEAGKLDLDAPIANYLAKPLPDYPDPKEDYANWPDLAGDDRWKRLTPRILLTHSSGFSNFGFLEPDGKLKFHFEPGSRYAYSGDGIILLQFVIEKGLGLDVGAEMQRRIFDRFDMPRTSMTWRDDFAGNLADGWRIDGTVEPHDERSRTRAAGSMDTTLADMSKFVAAYVRGDGLSKFSHAQLSKPQLKITAASQFPSLQPELPSERQISGLAAGLGVITFTGPQGPGFQKGGHNDSTGNTWVCVQRRKRCVLILSNDVRSEAAFPRLVKFAIGETGMPWAWEYGDMNFWEAR